MGALNSSVYLTSNLFSKKIKKVHIKEGYGRGLVKAGDKNPQVVVLCADVTQSTYCHWFKEKYPQRFIQVGVAEQNLAALASGMAAMGKIPYIASFAVFSPGRNYEQIRTAISFNSWGSKKGKEIDVKIVGAHAGISVGADGATHQALDDVGLMRLQPGMTVVVPCDDIECEKATLATAEYPGPVYFRFGRADYPQITTPKTPFKIGRMEILRFGSDCTIIANGPLVYEALIAAEKLKKEIDCQVLNGHTVKPLDGKTLLQSVGKTGCAVTAEEHQYLGGLGGAIAEFLSENYPVPVKRVGVKDKFGESGTPGELFKAYGLTAGNIMQSVREVVRMKRRQ